MAGTTTKSRPTAYAGSDLRDLIVQHNALIADVEILRAGLAALVAAYNTHTHNGDGSQAGAYYTSPPRTNAATVTAGTAGTVTATTYDAASDLTAAKIGNAAGTPLA